MYSAMKLGLVDLQLSAGDTTFYEMHDCKYLKHRNALVCAMKMEKASFRLQMGGASPRSRRRGLGIT
jgi:hypothetical protein